MDKRPFKAENVGEACQQQDLQTCFHEKKTGTAVIELIQYI